MDVRVSVFERFGRRRRKFSRIYRTFDNNRTGYEVTFAIMVVVFVQDVEVVETFRYSAFCAFCKRFVFTCRSITCYKRSNLYYTFRECCAVHSSSTMNVLYVFCSKNILPATELCSVTFECVSHSIFLLCSLLAS